MTLFHGEACLSREGRHAMTSYLQLGHTAVAYEVMISSSALHSYSPDKKQWKAFITEASSLPVSVSPGQQEKVESLALRWSCVRPPCQWGIPEYSRYTVNTQIDGQGAFSWGTYAIVHKSSGLAWFGFAFNPKEFRSDILTLFSDVPLELTCKASFQYAWDPELKFH